MKDTTGFMTRPKAIALCRLAIRELGKIDAILDRLLRNGVEG